jgi:hypothetical protein
MRGNFLTRRRGQPDRHLEGRDQVALNRGRVSDPRISRLSGSPTPRLRRGESPVR